MKIKIFQYIKSHLIISFILLLVLIAIIILPIYFLVINKSSSQEQPQNQAQDQALTQEQLNKIVLAKAQAQDHQQQPADQSLGLIYSYTKKSVESPKQFMRLAEHFKRFDDGIVDQYNKIQYKWSYDKTNIYTTERTILNTYNSYTPDELSELGKTSNPNTYVVNQIIPIYDKNNILLSKDVSLIITPMILSTYENYKNLYPND